MATDNVWMMSDFKGLWMKLILCETSSEESLGRMWKSKIAGMKDRRSAEESM